MQMRGLLVESIAGGDGLFSTFTHLRSTRFTLWMEWMGCCEGTTVWYLSWPKDFGLYFSRDWQTFHPVDVSDVFAFCIERHERRRRECSLHLSDQWPVCWSIQVSSEVWNSQQIPAGCEAVQCPTSWLPDLFLIHFGCHWIVFWNSDFHRCPMLHSTFGFTRVHRASIGMLKSPWLSTLSFAQIAKRWMHCCLGLRERAHRWPRQSATLGNSWRSKYCRTKITKHTVA